MAKRLIIAIVFLVLVSGGLVGFNLFRQQAIEDFFATMEQPAVTISAAPVEATTWQPVIEAFGTASAVRGVDVASEAAGVVRDIHFTANDRVEQGQLLVQIEDAVERAELIAARAAVERDRLALQRTRDLQGRGVAPQVNLETAESALAASRSQLERLQAVLERKAISAPFSGMIGIPRVEVGQFIDAGTVIATLQDLDRLRLDFTIAEQDMGRLRIGQAVRAGVAAEALDFTGRITGIEPRVDPTSRLVQVRAEIEGPEGGLRPGQFARVEVVLPEERGVMVLPQTALVTSLYGDYVYAVAEERAEDGETRLVARQTFVRTGRRAGGLIEIVDGLEPGRQVVTAGQNKVSGGARLKIDNTIDPAQLVRRGGAT